MAKKQEASLLSRLKADIKAKQLQRLYVFYGEEVFLLRHYLEQIKKLLLDELTEAFNYTRFNNENFSLQSFVDAVESFPMMSESTLVQVDDVDPFKLPEAEREKIASVLSDIPQHCTVVFTFETVSWHPDARMRKLREAFGNGCEVDFRKQERRDLIAWIQRHFAAAKKQIAPELCDYLIDITGGTMTALASEIRKVVSYSGAEHICRADIDAVVEPVLDAVVFQMTDMMGRGNYGAALQKLQQLFKMQEEPLAILGVIGAHFRKISTALTMMDAGKNAADLGKVYVMPEFAARRTMESARNFTPQFCRTAATLVIETDYRIKTSFDDAQRLLELLVLQLAQEARRD